MKLSPNRHDPLRGFKYRVTFTLPAALGGQISAGFSSITGLNEETEATDYRNGDEMGGVRKLPGISSYPDVVMERGQPLNGAPGAEAFSEWRKLIQTASSDGQLDEETLRGSFEVWVYRRGASPGNDPAEFHYIRQEVWPRVYEHSDLSGSSSDIWMERITFACEGGGQGVGTPGP